jgi:lipopolysaccharide export system protein LptA
MQRRFRLNFSVTSLVFLTCLALFSAASLSAVAKTSASQEEQVHVSADHQTFVGQESKTYLKGNVDVRYKNVQIKGKEGTMDMDADGTAHLASFFKRPTATRVIPNEGTDTLVADIIRIHIDENAISAEGDTITYVTTVAADPFKIRADTQQFDNQTKTVVARGKVEVLHKDTKAYSPRALLQTNAAGKAEKIIFSGGARVEQENSLILGERVTVMVDSGNLIAENNVKTTVDMRDKQSGNTKRVFITSDYQQYDKASDTYLASGNVKLLYDDYVAVGPKATFKLKDGIVEKIFMTGRSSITENGRKIVADKITIVTNPKHFDAYGNVKTQFEAKRDDDAEAASSSPGGAKPTTSSRKAPGLKPIESDLLDDQY